mmetsp:Transcript_9822/g.17109  ORF Transcript_9822/g.17109 Transcript_9822/m.17109 type:complete len:413 (+) Transcript_9822:908-2146(+)
MGEVLEREGAGNVRDGCPAVPGLDPSLLEQPLIECLLNPDRHAYVWHTQRFASVQGRGPQQAPAQPFYLRRGSLERFQPRLVPRAHHDLGADFMGHRPWTRLRSASSSLRCQIRVREPRANGAGWLAVSSPHLCSTTPADLANGPHHQESGGSPPAALVGPNVPELVCPNSNQHAAELQRPSVEPMEPSGEEQPESLTRPPTSFPCFWLHLGTFDEPLVDLVITTTELVSGVFVARVTLTGLGSPSKQLSPNIDHGRLERKSLQRRPALAARQRQVIVGQRCRDERRVLERLQHVDVLPSVLLLCGLLIIPCLCMYFSLCSNCLLEASDISTLPCSGPVISSNSILLCDACPPYFHIFRIFMLLTVPWQALGLALAQLPSSRLICLFHSLPLYKCPFSNCRIFQCVLDTVHF